MAEPFLASYYAVPFFAFYPVFIVLFGIGAAPIIVMGVLFGIVAMIMATLTGLDRVPLALRKTARLYRLGASRAALTIMTRNSRMPDSLAADLDAECSACLMGSRRLTELFERYGRTTAEACFDAIIANTAETYRREILSKIPAGTWTWPFSRRHPSSSPERFSGPRCFCAQPYDSSSTASTSSLPQFAYGALPRISSSLNCSNSRNDRSRRLDLYWLGCVIVGLA